MKMVVTSDNERVYSDGGVVKRMKLLQPLGPGSQCRTSMPPVGDGMEGGNGKVKGQAPKGQRCEIAKLMANFVWMIMAETG